MGSTSSLCWRKLICASIVAQAIVDVGYVEAVLEDIVSDYDDHMDGMFAVDSMLDSRLSYVGQLFQESSWLSELKTVDLVQGQIDWVRSNGGFVSSKVQVRHIDPTDHESPLGVFAVKDIEEGEPILSIPRNCLITSEQETPDWICDTSRNLARELRLGNESSYAPYINYLNKQPYGQLPSMWSDAGQDLLLEVTGGSRQEDDQILPPYGPVGWLDDEWRNLCDGGDDLVEQHAFLTVIQRGWHDILIPLYDLLNHRNGKWLNTISNSVHDPNHDVQVFASKFIQAGEQIYSSYSHCESCGGRHESYGTPEFVRDYGFVEMYPQKFIFEEQGVAFSVDREHESDNELKVIWHSDELFSDNEDAIEFFQDQLQRLGDVYDRRMKNHNEYVPTNEMEVLKKFTVAYIVAMERMLDVIRGIDCAVSADGAENSTASCPISPMRYSSLDEKYDEYDKRTCDKYVSLDFSWYDDTEQIQSHYQLSSYIESPENGNTCFDLDDIYQICGSYRPHYHEMVVHYTARFLPKIQRVLWVGGGDSMLLHEIIKYPDLEFVLGLELDQTVTRGAFKHFGSQPHWDNEKVQWWYGDAAKSLLMLPKSYFGTFDMVLVDLSETVMSALVTKDLDIMSALSLLLKPEGIFVKNELYFEKLNPIFKHTMQIHYYDVPVICSQFLCLGSNGVDFVNRELTDHKVETKLSLLDNVDHDFQIVHDYLTNPHAERHCTAEDEDGDELVDQGRSPGIVMILEAENVSAKLDSSSKLESLLRPALEEEGLSVVSTTVSDHESGAVLVVVLQQGYVVARFWSEHKYCALDIHMWSSFEKHDNIKNSLVAALGGESRFASSFRIVAGGMFGLSTWQEDYQARGPKYTQDCSDTPELMHEEPMASTRVDDIVSKLLGVPTWENVVATVLCGPQDQACHSIQVLSQIPSIRKVVPLYTCPSIDNLVEGQENSGNVKYACEAKLLEQLEESTEAGDKISIVVVDQSTTFAMAQVVNRITQRSTNLQNLFTHKIQVVAPIVDPTETWRQYFVDGFREVVPVEPAFMADLLFNTTESSLEIATFLSGDDHFISHMKQFQQDMQQRQSDLVVDIREYGGGNVKFQKDFAASQWFLPQDYDQREPYEQWHSQQPTGHQSIVQFEAEQPGDSNATVLSKELVKDLMVQTIQHLGLDVAGGDPVPQEFSGIGDGSVLVLIVEGKGQVIALYDGRSHVTVNLFTYEDSSAWAEGFATHWTTLVESLDVVLFDEMPRGYGRVVNFQSDFLEPHRQDPRWALHLLNQDS